MFDRAFRQRAHEVFLQDEDRTTTGTLIMKLAAISPGKSVVFSVKNRCTPTGKVSWSFRR